MYDKRELGQRRISWLHNLRKGLDIITIVLFRTAVNKVKTAMLIANSRNEKAPQEAEEIPSVPTLQDDQNIALGTG